MDLASEQIIPAPQAEVWRGLNDPEILKACIPGCETIEKIDDTHYSIALTAKVGPVKAKFLGNLVLADLDPPTSYSLAFEGSSGAAGFGKGSAQVRLAAQGSAATKLTYSVKASVGGRFAQIGSRLIDSVAMKMADEFFAKFKETMSKGAAASPSARSPYSRSRFAWLVAGVIVVAVLAYLFATLK